jgi:glycosyltransferase involved in cell wall biosynthesis
MIQPYPDGVSTRRSSVMAGVLYGVPIVTHKGEFTEKFWGESGAVVLLETMDVEKYLEAVKSLIESSEGRKKLGTAAAELYERKFALSNTINHLLSLRKRSPGS